MMSLSKRLHSKPVISSKCISFSMATFLDHCCSLSHNEHWEQDEPAGYCFFSHTGEAINDPHVCLWELMLLFSTCMGFPQPQLNSHHCHQELFSDTRLTTSLRVIKMSWMSLPWHNLTMDSLVLWHLRSFCLLFQDAPKPCVEDVPTEAEHPLSGVLHMLASCGFL